MPQAQPLQKPPGYRDPNLPIQRPPPRTPKLPPSFHPYKRRKSCCRSCCFCLCISILLLAVLLICIGVLFYFWCEPSFPVFNVKSFQLHKFKVANSPHGPKLNTQLKLSIEFRNTNKNIKLVYDKISMFVNGEDGLTLGEETVPGFVQEKNNATTVKFKLKGDQLVSKQEAKRLTDQFKSKSLKLTTEVRSGIGMVLTGWHTGTVGVKVTCGDTTLKQIQNGAAPKCKVYVFRLIPVS